MSYAVAGVAEKPTPTLTGSSSIFIPTDITQETEIKNLISQTVKTFGRLDCAFNNAGTPGILKVNIDESEEN